MNNSITKCRVSNSKNLISILDLGDQYFTGVFPNSKSDKLESGRLELVWCPESNLLQLKHSYPLSKMYGDNYGYRSGLNQSMVKHLNEKVLNLSGMVNLHSNDLVIDIGSNDATLLKAYDQKDIYKIGIDPSGGKFKRFYTDGLTLIEDFFPTSLLEPKLKNKKAKIITSIAMFYDLEDPLRFVREIADNLHIEGIWHLEQSYMPSMLQANAYDTICHEHLEYYTLQNIQDLVEQCGMKIIDVQLNDINGGSFAVSVAHKKSKIESNSNAINSLLNTEKLAGFDSLEPFQEFKTRVFQHRTELKKLIETLNNEGKKIIGYGASTKGNVLLQFCDFSEIDIPFIAEVNEDKFNCFTPGTNIPIISEKEAKKMKPDYFFVLPWHFKENILSREKEFIDNGGKFIFPLPYIEIV